MKHFKLVVLVSLVALILSGGMTLAQGGGQGKGGQGAAPMMGCQQRFDTLDTNKDGQVTKEEFLAAPHHGAIRNRCSTPWTSMDRDI